MHILNPAAESLATFPFLISSQKESPRVCLVATTAPVSNRATMGSVTSARAGPRCRLSIACSYVATVGTVAPHQAARPGRVRRGGEPISGRLGRGIFMSAKSVDVRVAFYARVSSDQQADSGTIASQIRALRERIQQDGCLVDDELGFIDDGYSGSTLLRPALERMRDAAANGSIDRLYVHSPDRLARKYAYQFLLLEELQRAGVEVIFLNRELGRTPEDDLLLQVQGVVAEYERAKILERSRRGKQHAARCGCIHVLGGAPYGYRYVRKQEGGGEARYEIVAEEAQRVQQ